MATPDVCLVSIARGTLYEGTELGDLIRKNKENVCAVCGYRCILSTERQSEHAAAWDKLLLLQKTPCAHALWVDADAMFLRPFQVQPLLRLGPEIYSRDFHGINAGVMGFSNVSRSSVLPFALQQTQYLRTCWPEQNAIRSYYQQHPASPAVVLENIARYAQSVYTWHPASRNRTLRDYAPIFHLAGCPKEKCTPLMKTALQWSARHEARNVCHSLDSVVSLGIRPLIRKLHNGSVSNPADAGPDISITKGSPREQKSGCFAHNATAELPDERTGGVANHNAQVGTSTS